MRSESKQAEKEARTKNAGRDASPHPLAEHHPDRGGKQRERGSRCTMKLESAIVCERGRERERRNESGKSECLHEIVALEVQCLEIRHDRNDEDAGEGGDNSG